MMPGKVNPVIAESLLMACAQVIGHDSCISWCCASGVFELNLMMPLLGYNLLDSLGLLAAASTNFAERCIRGLEADRERAAEYVEKSLAGVTGLVPAIGYERAAAIALEAIGATVPSFRWRRSGPNYPPTTCAVCWLPPPRLAPELRPRTEAIFICQRD